MSSTICRKFLPLPDVHRLEIFETKVCSVATHALTVAIFMCEQTDAYPFVEGAYQYVDLAMQWAAKYGIAVWLGVHAVNGSQNGYEASAPEIARTEIWDSAPKGSDPTYQNQSLTFVTQLCQRYGSSPALVAVSLMNEPTVRRRSRPSACGVA